MRGMFPCFFPYLAGSCNLDLDDMACVGEFRTTFRTIPASVAQWIEQRFPKPQVVGSIPTGGASSDQIAVASHASALSDIQ
ncbi:MAG: hypothetical protein RL119_737 [Actinomycetota bacterium]